MAKYNCATMDEYMMMLKNDIKQALAGKIDSEAASKEECDKLVLDTFDEAVYHLKEANAASCALDRLYKEAGFKLDAGAFQKYVAYFQEEKEKFNLYKYEEDEDE